MVRTLIFVGLAMLGLTLMSGCNDGQGPNDPVVSGQEINKSRESRMTDEEKARLEQSTRDAAIPGGGK